MHKNEVLFNYQFWNLFKNETNTILRKILDIIKGPCIFILNLRHMEINS